MACSSVLSAQLGVEQASPLQGFLHADESAVAEQLVAEESQAAARAAAKKAKKKQRQKTKRAQAAEEGAAVQAPDKAERQITDQTDSSSSADPSSSAVPSSSADPSSSPDPCSSADLISSADPSSSADPVSSAEPSSSVGPSSSADDTACAISDDASPVLPATPPRLRDTPAAVSPVSVEGLHPHDAPGQRHVGPSLAALFNCPLTKVSLSCCLVKQCPSSARLAQACALCPNLMTLFCLILHRTGKPGCVALLRTKGCECVSATMHVQVSCLASDVPGCLQVLMVDPVIAADGHTYERAALQEWLQHHTTSPVTGATLEHHRHPIRPNFIIKQWICHYRAHSV